MFLEEDFCCSSEVARVTFNFMECFLVSFQSTHIFGFKITSSTLVLNVLFVGVMIRILENEIKKAQQACPGRGFNMCLLEYCSIELLQERCSIELLLKRCSI